MGEVRNTITGSMIVGVVVQGEHVTLQLPAQTPAMAGLPAAAPSFTGRAGDVERVLRVLAPHHSSGRAVATRRRHGAGPRPGGASAWPGQPARPDHLSALLNELGVPAAAARGAAIRQQLLELPGPVVADALGYHDKTTSRLIREASGTWSRYAAGGHTRPTGWVPRRTAAVE
jgi:hypothetical protein